MREMSEDTTVIQIALLHQLIDDVKPTADAVTVLMKKIWQKRRYAVEQRATRKFASHRGP
jgi:hypothetical protein